MADGISIRVSAVGAQQAQADLKNVAAAEQQVAVAAKATAQPTAEAGAAHKKAGDATAFQMGESVKLLGVLRSMGPEGSILADVLGIMTTKLTGVGLVAGVAAASISIIAKAMQSLTAAGEAEQRKVEELRATIKKASDAYLSLAESIQDAAEAQGKLYGRDVAVPEAAADEAARIAARVPLSKRGIEQVGEAIAAGVKDREAFANWVSLGNAADMDGATASEAFKSAITADPGLPGKLRQMREARDAASPRVARKRLTAGAEIAAGTTEAGKSLEIVDQIATKENLAGRDRDRKQIANWFALLAEYAKAGGAERFRMETEHPELIGGAEAFLRTYPEAADVMMENVGPSNYFRQGASMRVAVPGADPAKLQSAGQVIYGGTHVHNHGPDDPAGVPPPARTGRTGR